MQITAAGDKASENSEQPEARSIQQIQITSGQVLVSQSRVQLT